MDQPIVVETRMTYQYMKKFMQYTMFRKGKGLKPVIIVMIVAMAVALVAIVGMMLTGGVGRLSFQTKTMLLLVPVILLMMVLMPTINSRLIQKSSGALFDSVQRYSFSQEDVRVETTGQATAGSGTYRYEAFHKVCETKDSFYLYINAQQAHLVPKRDVAPDSLAALAGLLSEKLGKKYIKCY